MAETMNIDYNKNYLFHGPGGCGKTVALKLLHIPSTYKVFYTAATGIAAINLPNGSTLHRWAGIGLAKESAEVLAVKVTHVAKLRWLKADILIIDEISMIGSNLFDKLDYIGRTIRKINLPFGGIRLILSGDFLQLSPINDGWIFNSKVWPTLDLQVILFDKMMRFNDEQYFSMLLRARKGTITDDDVNMLRKCNRPLEGDIMPTILYARKVNVNDLNIAELNKLDTEERIYESRCTGMKPEDAEVMYDIPHKLRLKIGAQVMLRINLDNKLVNGSRGIVVGLNSRCVNVKFLCGVFPIDAHLWEHGDIHLYTSISQIPLILAWAITIHKSQGSTLDRVKCNLGNSIFTAGQAYIALSRVRNLESLELEHLNRKKIFADGEALTFVEKLATN